MSFFGSLFGGQNENLNKDLGATADVAGFSTGLGKKNISTASKFWDSIMSGDSSKISQALSPEISAAKTSVQQDQKTGAAFGSRSGGTAAASAASSDKVHGFITNLIGSLTGNAAQNLAATGGELLHTGLAATEMNEKFSQDQLENWANSIIGRGITSGVSAAESAGLAAAGI